MFHVTTTDVFNVVLAVGTLTTMVAGLRNRRIRAFLMALRERVRFKHLSDAFSLSKMVQDLQDALESQKVATDAATCAADNAMKAVAAMQVEQEVTNRRLANVEAQHSTLETQYRNLTYYYNLLLNYCAVLLDYCHTLRERLKKHDPGEDIPAIPEQPAHLQQARTKYPEPTLPKDEH